MGDVNGDQIADVAVASHQNGEYQVSIYDGAGQVDSSRATGYAPHLLATIPDPFSSAAGPLDVALGDFTGSGISELAISAKNSNQISVWTFKLPASAVTDGPLSSPVIPVSMGAPFTPAGLENADGINLAAVSMANNGVYQLVATAATNGPGDVFVLSYGGQNSWQVTQTITGVPVKSTDGLSVSAGNLTNNGLADIVVGSQANGKVAVYSEVLRRWVWTGLTLGQESHGCPRRGRLVRGGTRFDRGDGRQGGGAAGGDRPLGRNRQNVLAPNIAWIGRAGAAGCRLRLSARYHHSLRGHCRRFFFVQI